MSNISLTDIRKSKSFQIFQTLLCFGILAAVLTFCFSLLKYSFYPVDEPYQIMNSMDYLNSPLAPLTAILDHFTNSLCGYDMLSAKFAYLYLCVPYWYCWQRGILIRQCLSVGTDKQCFSPRLLFCYLSSTWKQTKLLIW